jgi:hypothetical protein
MASNRYPEKYENFPTQIWEMDASRDLQIQVASFSLMYGKSREYKKQMKKNAKNRVAPWAIDTPIGESYRYPYKLVWFPSLEKAAYWLEMYITAGLTSPDSFTYQQLSALLPSSRSREYKKQLKEYKKLYDFQNDLQLPTFKQIYDAESKGCQPVDPSRVRITSYAAEYKRESWNKEFAINERMYGKTLKRIKELSDYCFGNETMYGKTLKRIKELPDFGKK